MPFASISSNYPHPQNLLPPSSVGNPLPPSLLHLLSWLSLPTSDSFVKFLPFCHPSATALFFLSFLKRQYRNALPVTPSDNSTCHLPAAWNSLQRSR